MAWVARNTGLASAQNQWWLSFGINANDVMVVYQPLGADNIADSYVNLAVPGVNNASPVVAPTFATGTGWAFNNLEHLTTNITGTGQHTVIIRAGNTTPVAGVTLSVGGYLGPPAQYIEVIRPVGNNHTWNVGYNASTSTPANNKTDDFVIGLSANQLYYNGTALGATTGTLDTWLTGTITIANNIVGGSSKFIGDIKAYAIYNRQLTAGEVSAISANMTALTSADDPTPAVTPVNYIVQSPGNRQLNSNSHELWLAGDDGVFRTFDGGRGWAKITLPDPSNAEFGDVPAATVDELTFRWVSYGAFDLSDIFVIAAKNSASRLWLYKSVNAGSTWTSRGVTTG